MPENKKTVYLIIGVAAVVIIVASVAMFALKGQKAAAPTANSGTNQSQTATKSATEDYSLTPATDTSNTALDKDINSVDTQINNLDSDSSAINQSLNSTK